MRPVVPEATAQVLARWPDGLDHLSQPERERAAVLRVGRDDFVAAHLLARERVAQLVGHDAAIRQTCERCGGPHGRPRVVGHPDIGVSWSHVDGYVVAVAGNGPVGVDLELVRDQAPLDRYLSGDEHPRTAEEFLQLWVGKEALVKVGVTDLDHLADVSLPGLLTVGSASFGGYHVTSRIDAGLVMGLAVPAPPGWSAARPIGPW